MKSRAIVDARSLLAWSRASERPLSAFEGVRVEKMGALRFSRSVGVEIERRRADFD